MNFERLSLNFVSVIITIIIIVSTIVVISFIMCSTDINTSSLNGSSQCNPIEMLSQISDKFFIK